MSLNQSNYSFRSGYILAGGQDPEESKVWRFLTDYVLCGCFCLHPRASTLTDIEIEYLAELRVYMDRPFDTKNPDHENLFPSIWRQTFPTSQLPASVDSRWTSLGFQSQNPRTDIRTGVHALEAIEYMACHYTSDFRRIVSEASNPATEYPFAASCVSIAFSLVLFFKLNSRTAVNPSGWPSGNRLAIKQFVRLSMAHANCFDEVFSRVTLRVHREWMTQPPGQFDIHYFAVALAEGVGAMANFFNHKRIRDLNEFIL